MSFRLRLGERPGGLMRLHSLSMARLNF